MQPVSIADLSCADADSEALPRNGSEGQRANRVRQGTTAYSVRRTTQSTANLGRVTRKGMS
jgi:hypothetical protein